MALASPSQLRGSRVPYQFVGFGRTARTVLRSVARRDMGLCISSTREQALDELGQRDRTRVIVEIRGGIGEAVGSDRVREAARLVDEPGLQWLVGLARKRSLGAVTDPDRPLLERREASLGMLAVEPQLQPPPLDDIATYVISAPVENRSIAARFASVPPGARAWPITSTESPAASRNRSIRCSVWPSV